MIKTVSVSELKELDRCQFEREYWSWVEHCYWEPADPECYLQLEEQGFCWDDMHPMGYSISYSQGDVANIRGELRVQTWMEFHNREADYLALYYAVKSGLAYSMWAQIKPFNDRSWSCANYDGWQMFTDEDMESDELGPFKGMDSDEFCDLVETQTSELEKELDDWAESQSRELYGLLCKDYEYASSEEQFIEHCNANDITFEVEVDSSEGSDDEC